MEEIRVLSPTAILGYGFPMDSFIKGMEKKPHVIAVDAGSTDPGPYYLGSGYSFTDRNACKRDLKIMIEAGVKNKIPVIVGSTGGSGADSHLNWGVDIVKEIAKENNLNFKLASISSEMDKTFLIEELKKGKIKPLHGVPDLEECDVTESTNIVAQIGVEPIIECLDNGADVILAGRAYDPTVFAALAIKNGYDEGLALHMGKILECASIAATPGSGSDCMIGYLRQDSFVLEPLNKIRKCTTLSVAAHTLYEKTNPYSLPGPGGIVNLDDTKFEQLSENSVKVSGTKFIKDKVYTVKLEGAKLKGYRTVSIAGTRDFVMINQIDNIIDEVKERVADNFKDYNFDYNLNFKIYGKNGVMGELEPVNKIDGHEICIVIDVVADCQATANTICSFARSTMLHYGYTGRVSTAGNLAFPFSPSDFKAGEVFVFSIYHVLEIDNPISLFKINYENL